MEKEIPKQSLNKCYEQEINNECIPFKSISTLVLL